MDEALSVHKKSLRALFEVYADFPNLKPRDAKLLSFDDFMLLMRHLHFFDEVRDSRTTTHLRP